MKVLHLPTSVGGNAWGLAQGERLLGVESQVLITDNNLFEWAADINLSRRQGEGLFNVALKRLKAFLELRRSFDVFHFNFGRSLIGLEGFSHLQSLDLPFYPDNAKLFVTYNGCDARQKYPTMHRTSVSACHNTNCYGGICNSGQRDRVRQKGIAKMATYVKHMWALNPDLLYFLPPDKSSFLPYTVSHFQLDPQPVLRGNKLCIVHAPTNRQAKGSCYILEALSRLQAKYPNRLKVIIIEGMPNSKAREAYKQADLVVDQVLIGWYGAFAVEVMLLGKPVIARINEDDLKFIPKEMREDVVNTIINADPYSIYEVLDRCINDYQFLEERARASLEYASKWHDPTYVARLTKEKYEL